MKSGINLLPVEFRRHSLMSVRVRQWTITLFICALVIIAVIAIQWQRHKNQKETLSWLRATVAPYQAMEQDLVRMRAELSQLHATRSLLAEARRATHTVKLLGLVSRSANKKLQVKSLQFKCTADEVPATNESKAAPLIRTELVLDGIAKDNLAISQMLANLKSGQVFDSVEVLKISETTSGKKDLIRSYSITCRIDEVTR